MISVAQLARAYGIGNVFSYDRPGRGLLLTSGTGGMLAGMDALPMCGNAWVLEGYRDVSESMRSFMEAATYKAPVVVLFGFYGTDSPHIAEGLLRVVPEERIVVYSNAQLPRGRQVYGFDAMTAAACEISAVAA